MNTKFSVRFLRLAPGILLPALVLSLGACSSTPPADGNRYLAPGERPSTLPWNAPETWEGKGQLGGVTNGAQAQGTMVGTGVH